MRVRAEEVATRRSRLVLAGLSLTALGAAGLAVAAPTGVLGGVRGSGIQATPDGERTLISKDVDGARWPITRNADDGTVTGNVYFPDGGEPLFPFLRGDERDRRRVTPSCSGAEGCVAAPCGGFDFISEVTLPLSFFALPEPPPLPQGALGRRRFSIDPQASGLRSYSAFGPTDALGSEGEDEPHAGVCTGPPVLGTSRGGRSGDAGSRFRDLRPRAAELPRPARRRDHRLPLRRLRFGARAICDVAVSRRRRTVRQSSKVG